LWQGFVDLIRGPDSLGAGLQSFGIKTVPSPMYPSPYSDGTNYKS
jgi:hypothetical protein